MEQLTTKYVQSKVFTADVQQLANPPPIYSLCSCSCSSVLVGFFSSFLLFLFFLYLCFHVSFPAHGHFLLLFWCMISFSLCSALLLLCCSLGFQIWISMQMLILNVHIHFSFSSSCSYWPSAASLNQVKTVKQERKKERKKNDSVSWHFFVWQMTLNRWRTALLWALALSFYSPCSWKDNKNCIFFKKKSPAQWIRMIP